MAGCSRRPSSPSPAPPLEDDDLLQEIFLRLPPQPPYLKRASLVSKRWRRLATDRKFLRRFRIHHRKPPLVGDFSYEEGRISFRSTLDPPYRIPADHFSPPVGGREWALVDCRHGRVLIINWRKRQVIVWDPITGDRLLIAAPPEFICIQTGAVLCAAGEQGHVHGACHSRPFKVAVVDSYLHNHEAVALASVYSSETGMWSDILSTPLPDGCIGCIPPSTLVGNTLHWLLLMNDTGILEFDLDRQRLAVTKRPPPGFHNHSVQIIQAEDGGVGLATLLPCITYNQRRLQILERKVNCNGAAVSELLEAVDLRAILGLGPEIDMDGSRVVHYAEDLHAVFVWVDSSVFMVQLKTVQSKELFKGDRLSSYHPFTSFYAQGISE